MEIPINKLLVASITLLCYVIIPSTYASGKSLNIIVSPQPLPAEGGGNFVGSKKCASCHEKINQNWLNSPHARAWQTLKDKRAEQDSSCLRCHSTGHGNRGGFNSLADTPHLVGVQCESCHGPASQHLAKKPDWSWIKANCATCQIRKICMGCHTLTHSPNFKLDSYLDKIKHPH